MKPKSNNSIGTKNVSEFALDLDGLLFEKRIISLNCEITNEKSNEWISKILLLDAKTKTAKKPIYLLINSYGGDAYCSLGISDIIRNCNSPVHTICTGVAFSGASLILASGTKRFITRNSRVMMHQAWQGGDSEITHSQLKNDAEESQKLHDQTVNIWHEVTNIPKSKLNKLLSKDTYLNSTEAQALGIIDEITDNFSDCIK